MRHVYAPSSGCSPTKPFLNFRYRPGPKAENCSSSSTLKRCIRAIEGTVAWLRSRQTIARVTVVIAPFICQIVCLALFESPVRAQHAEPFQPVDLFDKFIEEASSRFAVPARWIRAVIRVESGNNMHAISSRGAMGLMQIMPATWVELSARYGLSLDPFDARDNILAGTAYLKELHDRFGSAGFLAAYHAGPARYEQHLATGQALPPKTLGYVAKVKPLLGQEQAEHTSVRTKSTVPWREAPLFFARTDAR